MGVHSDWVSLKYTCRMLSVLDVYYALAHNACIMPYLMHVLCHI